MRGWVSTASTLPLPSRRQVCNEARFRLGLGRGPGYLVRSPQNSRCERNILDRATAQRRQRTGGQSWAVTLNRNSEFRGIHPTSY
eukprot:1301610-Prymnesium_polylepis.1